MKPLAQVESPDGVVVHQGNGDSANITFKSTIEGDYKACFTVKSTVQITMLLGLN